MRITDKRTMKTFYIILALLISVAGFSQVRPGTGGNGGPHTSVSLMSGDEVLKKMPGIISARVTSCTQSHVLFKDMLAVYNYLTLREALYPDEFKCLAEERPISKVAKCIFSDKEAYSYLKALNNSSKEVHKMISSKSQLETYEIDFKNYFMNIEEQLK